MLYQNILLKAAWFYSKETGRIPVLGNGPTYGNMKFTSSHISVNINGQVREGTHLRDYNVIDTGKAIYTYTYMQTLHTTQIHTHTHTHTEHKLYLCFYWLSSNIIVPCYVTMTTAELWRTEEQGQGWRSARGRRREGEEGRGKAGRAEASPWARARLSPEGQYQWAGRGKRLSGKPSFLSIIFELETKTFCASRQILQLQTRLLEVCQQSSWRRSKASRFCLASFPQLLCAHNVF